MKYIRMHQVEAEPMTHGEFMKGMGKTDQMMSEQDAKAEGYLVVYPDGYKSWCPKAQFEAAGRPCDGMTFGMAIEAMKSGKKVARRGWNCGGMWLCVPFCDGPKEVHAIGIWGKPNFKYAEQNGGTVKVMPYVTIKFNSHLLRQYLRLACVLSIDLVNLSC